MANEIQTSGNGCNRNSQLISWIFCAFAFVLPLILKPGMKFYATAPKEALLHIGTAIIMAMILFRHIRDNLRFKTPMVVPAMLIVALYSLSTLLWAIDPYTGFMIAITWTCCAFVILIVSNEVNINQFLTVLFLSGFFISVIGLLQKADVITFIPQSIIPAATLANKNCAARYVAIMIPIAGWLWNRTKYRMGLAGIVFGMLSFVLITRTDAALLALIVAGIFYCVIKKQFKTIVPIVLSAVIAGLILKPDALMERLDIWEDTYRMIIANPMGVGIANFVVHYPLYYTEGGFSPLSLNVEIWAAHNDFVQFWAETGCIGAILLVIAGTIGIKEINLKNTYWPFIAASMVVLLTTAFFSFPFYMPVPVFVGACLTGALVK